MQIKLVVGEITKIDLEKREVEATSSDGAPTSINYDILLISMGVDSRPDTIPGMKEALEQRDSTYVYSMCSMMDMAPLRQRLTECPGKEVRHTTPVHTFLRRHRKRL